LGTTALNLTEVSLNEDGLVLTPPPVPGPDASDGRLTIHGAGNTKPIAVADDYYDRRRQSLDHRPPPACSVTTATLDGDPLTPRWSMVPCTVYAQPEPGWQLPLHAAGRLPRRGQLYYRAADGVDSSDIATVSLTIHPVNDAPDAVDDSYTCITARP
jgi:hypothetical protein